MLESLNSLKFLMAFLNLVILFLVLRKVLFQPVMQFMENRTKSIENAISEAQKQKAEALEMKADYEAQLKSARTESRKIVDAAVAKATAQQETIVAEAKQQAEELRAKAEEEIEQERRQMLRDVRNEVASLALAAASKVLQANIDSERNRELVNEFIDKAGAA